jgi:hypothetical protein
MKKLFSSILMLCFVALAAQSQEFPIATGSYSTTYPSSAYANGDYFTSFLDKRTGSSSYGFYAKFVDPEGTVFPDEHKLVDPIYYLSFMHELVYGDTNYIFAWARGVAGYSYNAYVEMVGNDGEPQSGMTRVSIGNTASASFEETAFDGENYLVIWQEGMPGNGSVIRGQFVNTSAQLVGNNFSIRPPDLATSVSQIYPDIVFNGENYFVVWDDNRTGNRDVYGQFVDTDGNLLGEDITITNHNADQLLVQLAFSGSNYLAVWADERLSSNDKAIFGQLIDFDGTLNGNNQAISPPSNSEGRTWPDVVASQNEYLVVWDQEWLEYDKPADNKNEITSMIYEAAGIEMARPIVWYDIYARKVSFDGVMISDEMPVCTTEYHQQDCNVASDGIDFLVTWSDSRNANQYNDIYGAIVEGTESPDPPTFDPEFIEFTNVSQIVEGETFSIVNPSDEDFMIDTMVFLADPGHFWWIEDLPDFPININANSSVDFMLFLELSVGGSPESKDWVSDTLVALNLSMALFMELKIDEVLYDTLYGTGMQYNPDSIMFSTVDQALSGQVVQLTNPHMSTIFITDAFVTGPWGGWEIETGWPWPIPLGYGGELDMNIFVGSSKAPLNQKGLLVDTIWFQTGYDSYDYFYPIHFYSEIIDSIFTGVADKLGENNGVRVFPNPAMDFINISIDNQGVERVIIEVKNISSTWNELIFDAILNPGEKILTIALDEKAIPGNGIYFLNITMGSTTITKKILIYQH